MSLDANETASRGGKARAEKLSPERRKEIARMGAQARALLSEAEKEALPAATHRGSLKIQMILFCHAPFSPMGPALLPRRRLLGNWGEASVERRSD